MPATSEVVHGTCVALGGRGILLRGPSGSGKSDLALRFLCMEGRGPATLEPMLESMVREPRALVADDQVRLRRVGSQVMADSPESIRGKIEVRGVGIVSVGSQPACALALVVDLVPLADVERLPSHEETVRLLGIDLPLLRLAPFEPSAPIKLALAVAHTGRS